METTFHDDQGQIRGCRPRQNRDVSQVNEVLVKILCHNIVVLIQSMFELGAIPAFAEIQNQRHFVQDGQLHKMSA